MARVKDPVCGMIIDPTEAAASYELNGTNYYFCSIEERDAFVSDPSSYLDREVPIEPAHSADDVSLETHEPPFTNKGIPAPKFGSAGSGGAEFEPGPERHTRDDRTR
jgi:YHS domain-containing protein